MSAVKDYIASVKKKNPAMRIGSLHDISEAQKYPPLPSGNPVFDYVTSIGGIPRGLVTEIRGYTSSGKTSIATQIAALHQKAVKNGEAEGAILYLDFEHTVSESYFNSLGIDTDDEETFIYMQPDTLEDGMNMFLNMTRKGLLALGIVDSVAASSSSAEYDNEIGKASIGLRARGFSQALRMCVGPMRVNGAALILINHEQAPIPQGYAEQQAAARGVLEKVSPGGKAIEYYTALRIGLSKPSKKTTEEVDDLTKEKAKQVTSTEVYANAFKNKVGIPHRTGKMKVSFGKGFSSLYSSFHILVDHGIIKKKSGGHYVFPQGLEPTELEKAPVGEANILEAMDNDLKWRDKVIDTARRLVVQLQTEMDDSPVVVLMEGEDEIDAETGEVLSD